MKVALEHARESFDLADVVGQRLQRGAVAMIAADTPPRPGRRSTRRRRQLLGERPLPHSIHPGFVTDGTRRHRPGQRRRPERTVILMRCGTLPVELMNQPRLPPTTGCLDRDPLRHTGARDTKVRALEQVDQLAPCVVHELEFNHHRRPFPGGPS